MVSGSRFRVSGFGFMVSGFGFRVSGFGSRFRVDGFAFRVSAATSVPMVTKALTAAYVGARCVICPGPPLKPPSGAWFRISSFGIRVSGSGF